MSSKGHANQTLRLGRYEAVVNARLDKWQQDRLSARIWEKDFTVWSPTRLPEIADRLGWLTLPETMKPQIGTFEAFAQEIRVESFKHVVLLGMGGSSLAPEVYQRTLGVAQGFPQLIVLDSTHPDRIRQVESGIDLSKTLFLVASKSGTTQEPLSMFRHFFACLSRCTPEPGRHLIATTDPGTPLEALARKRHFRRVFTATPDVGGRYSALTAFGLVPAALIGADVRDMIGRAGAMARACGPSAIGPASPGLVLGAALGELALVGRDKVTFITSPSLEALPDWLEQLIAESTGKAGKGIMPVAGEALGSPEIYGHDRFFIFITTRQEADLSIQSDLEDLAAVGHPTATITLRDTADLTGEMFKWEMAVAAAGSVLGIHPFNQPDVQLAKDLARKAMDAGSGMGSADTAAALPAESSGRLVKALADLMAATRPGDYFAIQAYLSPTEDAADRLQAIRHHIRNTYRLATTLGFGPRFLHSTGQLHKGGPDNGIFLQLIDTPVDDLAIPETDHTFGRLIQAQAQGDYEALRSRNRRVLRVNLGKDPIEGLSLLADAIMGSELTD